MACEWRVGTRFAQRHRGEQRRQGKPALHRGEFIRNISICCTFLGVFISFGCGRNRGPGGELLPSSLHRGRYGEPDHSSDLFSVETAVKQPALSSLFRLKPNRLNCIRMYIKSRYFLYIPLCARRACPAASVSSVSLCETVPPPSSPPSLSPPCFPCYNEQNKAWRINPA